MLWCCKKQAYVSDFSENAHSLGAGMYGTSVVKTPISIEIPWWLGIWKGMSASA